MTASSGQKRPWQDLMPAADGIKDEDQIAPKVDKGDAAVCELCKRTPKDCHMKTKERVDR